MPIDAGTVIGIAIGFFGIGVAAYLVAEAVIRVKRFQRETDERILGLRRAEDESRLARIEQIVEVTAVEVERVAEAQRFLSRALAERQGVRPPPPDQLPSGGRTITPH